MRYAIRFVTIDGKKYNRGDIVPENVADVATMLANTKSGDTPEVVAEPEKEVEVPPAATPAPQVDAVLEQTEVKEEVKVEPVHTPVETKEEVKTEVVAPAPTEVKTDKKPEQPKKK